MKQPKIKTDLILFYFYQFFSNLDFARGIFVIYLMERGISASQVGLIQSVLFITSMVAEVPTGILADKFSRKKCVVAGLTICGLVPIGLAASGSLLPFLALFFLLALGYSLERGADTALLYSRIESEGDRWKSKFKRVMGRARATRYTALSIAIFAGGILQQYGWSVVFGAVTAAMMLGITAISFFHEPKHANEIASVEVNVMREGPSLFASVRDLAFNKKSRHLIHLILGISFLQAASTPLFIFAQVLFKSYELTPKSIGFAISAGLVANSIVSAFAHKLPIRNEVRFSIGLCSILVLSIATLFLRPALAVALAIFLLSQSIPPLLLIHFTELFISEVPSKIRATAMSLMSLIGALLLGLSNVLFGLLIDTTSVHVALGSLFFLPAIALAYFLIFLKTRPSL